MKRRLLTTLALLSTFGLANAQPGTLDLTFNTGLGPDGAVNALVTQPDGRIVIGGRFSRVDGYPRTRIARLLPNGELDIEFAPGSGATRTNESPYVSYVLSIVLLEDAQMLIAGGFSQFNGIDKYNVARLNVDGSLDSVFNPPRIAVDIRAVVVQSNAFVIGSDLGAFVRLDAQGTLDGTYLPDRGDPEGGQLYAVEAIARQTDGKLVVYGLFNNPNPPPFGSQYTRLYRLDLDGTWDTNFTTTKYGPGPAVGNIAIQPDGKIISSVRLLNPSRSAFIRLNPDGTPDPEFFQSQITPNGTSQDQTCVALQQDGKILIGGAFTSVSGVARKSIARLNPDGTLDTSFDAGEGPNGGVRTIAILPNSDILIGGSFTAISGVERKYIARLFGSTPAPRLEGARLQNGIFSIQLPTVIDKVYRLEFADSLPSSAWLPLSTNSGDGTMKTLTDPNARDADRFYRVVTH